MLGHSDEAVNPSREPCPCSNILHTKASAQGSMLPMCTLQPPFVGKCEEGAEGPLWKEEDRRQQG